MRNFILKILLFAVVLLVALSLTDRHLPYYWGNEGLVSKMNKVKADGYQYNTYFVGSSRMYRHVMPALFDSLNGGATHSFNLSYSGTKPPETYHFLDHFLDECSNDTKYIFLELGMIADLAGVNRTTLRSMYYLDFQQYKTAALSCFQNKRYETVGNYTMSYLSKMGRMGMLQSMWEFEGKTNYSQALGRRGDGYYGLEDEMADVDAADSTFIKRLAYFYADTMTLTKRYEATLKEYQKNKSFRPAASANVAQINRLIEKAKRKGIKLILLRQPRNPGLLSLYQAIPDTHKMDMCDPMKYPDFYLAKYSFDVGHFNSAGAGLFTRALSANFQDFLHKN